MTQQISALAGEDTLDMSNNQSNVYNTIEPTRKKKLHVKWITYFNLLTLGLAMFMKS